MPYLFASFELDPGAYTLRAGEDQLELRPKVFETLCFLVERAPSVASKDDLLAAVWSDVATTEESLTQVISQARKALAAFEPNTELIRTVRGHGYGMAVPVQRVEPLAQDAVAAAPAVAPGTSESHHPPSKLRWGRSAIALGAVGLLLTLAALARDPGVLPPPTRPEVSIPIAPGPAASIAVLPFLDLSPSGDLQYLGDGLAEELIDALAAIPGLAVASRTSAFAQRDLGKGIKAVGANLGVSTLVEGSVRVADDRIRTTVQLIRASDGFHIWSKTFDRELAGLIGLQNELAQSVAAELSPRLIDRGLNEDHPVSANAKLLFLRARAQMVTPSREGLTVAVETLERAVAIEPEYAAAWAALAEANLQLWLEHQRDEPRTSLYLEIADQAIQNAVAIAPDEPRTQRVLGKVLYYRHRDWKAAGRAMRRAIALAPQDVAVHTTYASTLAKAGRTDEALDTVLRGMQDDPMRPSANKLLARVYYQRAEYDKAIALLHRVRALNPHDPDIASLLTRCYHAQGRMAEAREAMLLWFSEPLRSVLRVPARLLGPEKSLRALLQVLIWRDGAPCGGMPWPAAHTYAGTGEVEPMLVCLEQASQRSLFYIAVEPVFDPYRGDPRFQALLEREGYGDSQLARVLEE